MTRLRPETDGDAAAVAQVITVAFDHHLGVADIWAGLGRHRRAGVVAVDGDRVVGHVGLSRAWVDARRELVDVWVLSPLSVLPDWRQRGIGGDLVAAAIEAAREAGTPALFLEGDPGYYGARGFATASALGFRPASSRTPDGAFQVVAFDAREPWMTGRLVYPEIWWEHDAAGLRDPRLARLEEALGVSD